MLLRRHGVLPFLVSLYLRQEDQDQTFTSGFPVFSSAETSFLSRKASGAFHAFFVQLLSTSQVPRSSPLTNHSRMVLVNT